MVQQSCDAQEIAALGKQAQEDLKAILAILQNTAFKQYKLDSYIVPDAVKNAEKLLSSASQNKIARRRFGRLDRFLTWFLDPPKPAPDKTAVGSKVVYDRDGTDRLG